MEATLQEILDAREHRAQRQQELLRRFQKPLVCFTMNIAGPEKNSELIERAFRLGEELLSAQLSAAGICPLFREHRSAERAAFRCRNLPAIPGTPVS